MSAQASIGLAIANATTGEAVIYVTQDTAMNDLVFTVTYSGSSPVTFKGGTPVPEGQITPQSPTSFYFTITPFLTPAEFQAIKVAPPAGWQAAQLTSFALTPVSDITVQPGDSFVFRLTNLAADGQTGPGSFNVTNYNVPGVADNGTQLALALELPPSTHKRLADVLTISFAEGNTVFIDVNNSGSIPPNALILRLDNTALQPIVPPETPWPGTPVLYLSFVTATSGPGYGALTTIDRLKNVTVSLAGDYGTTWTIQDRTQETPPHWVIYPKSQEILGIGASAIVEFRIDGIITSFEPSGTNLYLQSSGIPGFDDGVQALVIDKRPPQLAIQDFSSGKNNVAAGTQVPLNWRTFDANRCELSPVNGQSVPVPVQSPGTYTVTPTMTTTYTLTAFNDTQGTRTSLPLTIDVLPVRFTQQLSASPSTGIHYGDPVSLSWATSSATACTISPPVNGSSTVPLSASGLIINPAATVQYTVTAQGQNGPVQSSLTIVPIPNGWRSAANAGLWNTFSRPVLIPDFAGRLWFLAGGSEDLKSAIFRSIDGFTWDYATDNAAYSPRGDAAGCVFNGRMWLTGGKTRAGSVNEIWSSADGVTWTQVAASGHWSPRSRHACLAFAGKLWVFGGADANGQPLGDVWNSLDGVNWTQVTAKAVWPARSALGAVVFGGAMCIIAGSGASGPLADAWQSTDGLYWDGLASTPNWLARSSPNVNVVNGSLYVIGGTGRDGKAISDNNILVPGKPWSFGAGPGWSGDTLNIASAAFLGAQWFTGGMAGAQANRTVWGLG
ncbi:MAG: hypothetical protein C0457_04545 [Polymorphum sp.]|uniref:Kelch motif n=1 Tax=Pannonibacter phragmitetus TaxID=121719 RepID=A0A0U2W506_9HYPH|nr:kelch repeat-containing protein [Pannonibacter phragmitetus]ALV27610.1 hypothetical protein APZ00_11480 [Pannonibacter phragmitetus]MBA4204238.1 hypothetical protein [Polymorphum sp.]